jgi:hypothetical protein
MAPRFPFITDLLVGVFSLRLKNFLGTLIWPAVIFGAVVSGNAHQPSEAALYLGAFALWFVIGYLVTIPFCHRK